MQINFFEEYFPEQNQAETIRDSLARVPDGALIFVAAPNYADFAVRIAWAREEFPQLKFGWWPTISGAYWLSNLVPYAQLQQSLREILDTTPRGEAVLIDLEFPYQQSWLCGLGKWRAKTKLFTKFYQDAQIQDLRVYTAQYWDWGPLFRPLSRWLGLNSRGTVPHKKILMAYSSYGRKFLGPVWSTIIWPLNLRRAGRHDHIHLGIGLLSAGIGARCNFLTPEQLEQELRQAKEVGASEVFVYQLNGLTAAHAEVCKRYADSGTS